MRANKHCCAPVCGSRRSCLSSNVDFVSRSLACSHKHTRTHTHTHTHTLSLSLAHDRLPTEGIPRIKFEELQFEKLVCSCSAARARLARACVRVCMCRGDDGARAGDRLCDMCTPSWGRACRCAVVDRGKSRFFFGSICTQIGEGNYGDVHRGKYFDVTCGTGERVSCSLVYMRACVRKCLMGARCALASQQSRRLFLTTKSTSSTSSEKFVFSGLLAKEKLVCFSFTC